MIEFPKVVTDKFDVIPGPIGGGSFGQVWRVREKSSQKLYAMKRIITPPGDQRGQKNIDNEIRILSEINNEYIVHLKLKIENGNEVYIIMDYFENMDLAKAIVEQNGIPFEENQIWKFLIQICLGLKCLHSNNIIHRDIKPQNIFLDRNNNIKIGDFGLSRYSIASGVAGTQIYFSPEMWASTPPSYESDIWALGCVLYELCNFEHPFGNNRGRIISCKHNSIRSQYSDELRYIVDWCLEKSKERRPTIYMLLEREFIVQIATYLGIALSDNNQQYDTSTNNVPQIEKLGSTRLPNRIINYPLVFNGIKSGIPNIGNTCYLNSLLQILASNNEFCEKILALEYGLFSALSSLLLSIRDPGSNNTNGLVRSFKNQLGSEFPWVMFI